MTKAKPHGPLACSFCGLAEADTAKLIACPGVYICGDCVHLCVEILDEEGHVAPSKVQESTLVLEDGSRHLVAAGLREAVSILGTDDSTIVATLGSR